MSVEGELLAHLPHRRPLCAVHNFLMKRSSKVGELVVVVIKEPDPELLGQCLGGDQRTGIGPLDRW